MNKNWLIITLLQIILHTIVIASVKNIIVGSSLHALILIYTILKQYAFVSDNDSQKSRKA